jgi:hypothetical protein
MNRKRETTQTDAVIGDDTMIRDGHLLIEDDIVRGEGHVTYVDRADPAPDESRIETRGPAAATTTTGAAARPIPPMTNDNTDTALETTGSMMADSTASGLLNRVRLGMKVVDANGEELGRVDEVKMGDPGAATIGADRPAEPGLIAGVFGAEAEPDVPEPLRSRLLRFGYVKIDGKGWVDTDRYVTAGQIGRVAGDTVTLTADKERLLAES